MAKVLQRCLWDGVVMEIKITCSNNRVLIWHYDYIESIDNIVAALKENLPTWQSIEIKIENKS